MNGGMTIVDFSDQWFYWGPLLAAIIGACWLMRAKPFDFSFMVIMVLAQYSVHSVLAFGINSEVAIFCIAFFAIFLVFGQERLRIGLGRFPPAISFPERLEERWITISKCYLLVYYCARLALYPFFSGELVLDDRLEAQKDNALLYVAGLAITPAIAAVMYAAMSPGRRASLFDKVLFVIVAIGLLGAGSKAGLAFLIFTFVGASSYLGQSVFRYKLAIVGVLLAIGGTVYALKQFFPGLDMTDIWSLMLYRVAGNTDSLEYLHEIGLAPNDFPYAGIGALYPFLAKRLGYSFEYPAGVWLHGTRFGNWDGFGPNSGIVMDYLGNLGWVGLLIPLLIGIYFRVCRARPSVVMCSFLSMTYVLVVDVALFDIAWTFWILVLGVLLLMERYGLSIGIRFPLLRWGTTR